MKSQNQTILSMCAFLALIFVAAPVFGQQQIPVSVHQASMSIPFGEVSGTLIQVGDYLVFVDQDQRENSFAVRRADIRQMTAQDDTVNVELSQPVRGRSGQIDRLAFRLQDRAAVTGLTNWRGSEMGQQAGSTQSTGTTTSSTGAAGTSTSNGIVATYPVKHSHTFGDCRGNLIIRENGMAYESINELDHSRQWAFRDIRELHRDNPYEMSVSPFAGDTYDFDFMGKGMDNNVFQTLAQRVTSARVAE